ncbi:MAG: prolyl oligopeptidase family serine peptidase [Myxococcota bacterium]
MKKIVLVLFLAGCAASPRVAPLRFDDVFANPGLVDRSPSTPKWSESGEHFAFTWRQDRSLWVANRRGAGLRKLDDGPVVDFIWLGGAVLFIRGDTLWSVDPNGAGARIGAVGLGAASLQASPDGKTIAYLRGGDMWTLSAEGGSPQQHTRIGIPALSKLRVGRYNRPEREIGPGIWGGPTFAWAPDSRTIAVHLVDRRRMRRVAFPDYLAADTDPNEIRRSYPGDANESRTVAVLDLDSGDLETLDIAKPSEHQIIGFAWSASGTLLIDIASDTAVERSLYTYRDETLRRLWNHSRPTRMYTRFASAWAGDTVVFLSDMEERYGLYALSPGEKEPRRLTDPRFDVLTGPIVRGDTVFYSGNGPTAAELHVYRVSVSTKETMQLTNTPGQNRGVPSPDGASLVVLRSSDLAPTELYVADTPVTRSISPEFTPEQWSRVRYVSFPSAIDDYTLHARILEPADLDPTERYPVIFGPVYSNTVRNRWSPRYSMIQQLLAAKGYIVVQVDVRGSDGYGRAFREEFLKDFAGNDIEDLASAVSYLKTLPYVDPARFGIWGSSYGGTLSVYSLLKKPGLFRAAVAAAAAVDPAFFGTDDVAIVRRPDSAPEIFARKAKALASELSDHLLLIHGLQDQVVPVKSTMELMEALIAADKNFDVAIAPGATHGWARESAYAKFLFRKLVEHFDRHLMAADGTPRH